LRIEDSIRAAVHRAGIPLFGIAAPLRPAHYTHYLDWIAADGHAGMAYLARPDALAARAEPALLLENAKSILIFGFPYPHDIQDQLPPGNGSWGQIAAYAAHRDYHTRIPQVLEQLIPAFAAIAGHSFNFRIFSDSAPLLERDIAHSAGLGWIGRNGMLISPDCGSYFLLAEMITDLDLQPTPAFPRDHCGKCRRCLQACPTGCIRENHTLDAGRCIAYLTIENKGVIPDELRPAVGSRVFGCDICQQVCPWNRKLGAAALVPEFNDTRLPLWLDLEGVFQMDNQQFKEKYRAYPLLRAKRSGILRNAAVVLGNQARPQSLDTLRHALEDEAEALIRRHAAWALGRMASAQSREVLQRCLASENDPEVRREITAALAGL
jgi:epoxyqueuosine reductase